MTDTRTTRKWTRIVLRALLAILALVLLVLATIYIAIKTPWGNNKVRSIAQSWLEKKLQTKLTIGGLDFRSLQTIAIYNVSLKDRSNTDLLQLDTLKISIDINSLLSKTVDVSDLRIAGLDVHIQRKKNDPFFNYQFIIDAFTSSETTAPVEKDQGQSWSVQAKHIELSRINFLWDDGVTTDRYQVSFSELALPLDHMDLNKMKFKAGDAYINNLFADIRMGKSEDKKQDSSDSAFHIELGKLSLNNTRFNLSEPSSGLSVNTNAELLMLTKAVYDLDSSAANALLFVARGHNSAIQYRSTTESNPSGEPAQSSSPFTLLVDSVAFINNKIKLDDLSAPVLSANQFDANHIQIDSLDLYASSVVFTGDRYAAQIRHLHLEDGNGFNLLSLKGDLEYRDTSVSIKDLAVRTRKNSLNGSVELSYPSLADIMTVPSKTRIKANIQSTTLHLDELKYFQPSLGSNKQLKNVINKDISVDLSASGTLADLRVNSYSIITGNNVLKGSARLVNITDPKKMDADLRISELASSRQSLKQLLPDGLLTDSAWAYVPERFNMRGSLDVSPDRIVPDLVLNTNIGTVTMKGRLDHPSDKQRALYDLSIIFRDLAVGNILSDSSYGNVTGDAKLKGRGFDLPTMQANADVNIVETEYKGVPYSDVSVKATADHGSYSANIQSTNPGVDLDADLAFRYNRSISEVKVYSDIRNLDLHSLGLMDSVFLVKGRIDADFPVVDTSRLEGKAMITGVSLQSGSRIFPIDSLMVNAVYDSIQHLDINSDFADVQALGMFTFPAIPRAGKQIINNWLHNDSTKQTYSEVVIGVILADVHIPDSLAPLIPGLKSIGRFKVNASVNTKVNQMFFAMQVPYVEYGDYKIDSINMSIFQSGNYAGLKVPRFGAEFKKLQAPKFTLNHTELLGSIYEGELITVLKLMDQKGTEKYSIPVTYHHDDNLPYVFLKDTIILNSTRWNVNENNRIYLNTDKLSGSNLSLSKLGQSISVKANEANLSGYPLEVNITDFQLESLTSIALSQTGLVEGKLNGKFVLNSQKPFAFKTDMKIDSLGILSQDIGNLEAHVATDDQGRYNIDLTVKENGNDMKVDGYYDGDKKEMDIHAVMKPFNISPFGFLVESYVDSFSGGLMGDVRISGSTDKPVFNGDLELDSASLILRQTGARMTIPIARFKLNGRDIEFDGLDILDSAGNKARVTGTAIARDLNEVSYDLKMDANRFLVAGRTRYEDQLISGPLWASMALKLKGDLSDLNIDGNVKVLDSSVLTYVYRKDDNGIEGEGLIEFFDPNDSTSTDSIAIASTPKKTSSINLNVNTYIALTPTSTAIIVLDEFAGDQIKVKGDANLNFTMGKGIPMELVGAYKVESGTYNLSIGGIIKKEFDIQKGSTITWSGDLLKAKTDLTALYKLKTDAEELVQDNETIKGASKQKLNFEVYLNIKGELLQPVITFKLDMPNSDQAALDGSVYTRIKQINTIPSELNKQVMGLLALNSFIADNPFSSLTGGGGSMETTAFSTVGSLLSQELNDFLGDMIKDVDIDVGLDIRDDYTSGSAKRRSDLNVAFTKSFANNRLMVYVGNTFALEDQNQHTDLLSGLAGDVSIEYLLTSDGRYRLRGYRETKEDLTFNGMVVETGATFVVVVEFNKLKNAFKNREAKRKQAKNKS